MATESPTRSVGETLKGRGYLTGAAGWIVAAMMALPLFIIVYKLSGLPGADSLRQILSLADVSGHLSDRVEYVLFVPLGAVLIVFLRVTLGIRVLGPFRSILLAIAFQITGITVGLFFLAMVIAVLVALRPLLKAIRLPYFARVSTALSAVAIIIVATLLVGREVNANALTQVAYFPIVVLCLTGDGFARTLEKEGLRSALWRGAMTALAAVAIAALSDNAALAGWLINYPELILLEVGLIIVISEFLGFRLLAALNPPAVKSKKKSTRKSVADAEDKRHRTDREAMGSRS